MPEEERSATADRMREMVRDGFTLMLGAAGWAGAEGERLIRSWMDRGQVTKEEGKRMLDQLMVQARKSREELSKAVAEGVRNATAAVPVVSREQVARLEKRIDELTKKVEKLEKRAKKPN